MSRAFSLSWSALPHCAMKQLSLRSPRPILPDSQELPGIQQRRLRPKVKPRPPCLSQDTGPTDIQLMTLLSGLPLPSVSCFPEQICPLSICPWLLVQPLAREKEEAVFIASLSISTKCVGPEPPLTQLVLTLYPLQSALSSLHPCPNLKNAKLNSQKLLIAGLFAGAMGAL